MDYKTVLRESNAAGEASDCAVSAVAIALDVDYQFARGLLAASGRKHRL